MFGRGKKNEKATGGNKNTKRKKGKKGKKNGEIDDLKNQDQIINNAEDLFNEVDDQGMFGGPMDETEKILLNLHSNLIDFYNIHKPENLDEDVLTILMQFFIDAGGVALNKKLKSKYGEDLTTFNKNAAYSRKSEQEPPPPPLEEIVSPKPKNPEITRTASDVTRTMVRASKQIKLEKDLGMQIPPPPKFELKISNNTKGARNSLDSQVSVPPPPSSPTDNNAGSKRNKKVVHDPELDKYKEEKDQEMKELQIHPVSLGATAPSTDNSLRMDLLDHPDTDPLEPRDYIEAFYAKFDESKLDSDTGIEKFVQWVDQHSLEELSDKLKVKYGEGLFEQAKAGRRRKNLEVLLTNFYLKYDRGKLETRWTIMKILNWTMTHGVAALNRKFMTRYGHPVVEEMELDI